jgi:flagellar basal body-associated protein FliL
MKLNIHKKSTLKISLIIVLILLAIPLGYFLITSPTETYQVTDMVVVNDNNHTFSSEDNDKKPDLKYIDNIVVVSYTAKSGDSVLHFNTYTHVPANVVPNDSNVPVGIHKGDLVDVRHSFSTEVRSYNPTNTHWPNRHHFIIVNNEDSKFNQIYNNFSIDGGTPAKSWRGVDVYKILFVILFPLLILLIIFSIPVVGYCFYFAFRLVKESSNSNKESNSL